MLTGMTPLWYTKIIPEASRKLDWRKQKCSTSRTKGYCFTCHNDIDNKEDFNIFTTWNSSILGSILLHWHIPLGNKTSLFRFWKCFNKRLKLFTMCCLYSLSTFVSVTIQQNTPMFQRYSWPCDNQWLVLSTVPFTMFLGSIVWTVSLVSLDIYVVFCILSLWCDGCSMYCCQMVQVWWVDRA